jgi:ABC-2 type transport system permease protein
MIDVFTLVRAEFSRQIGLLKSYYVNTVLTQLVYILSFVLLSGLSNIVTAGNFNEGGKLAFLIGYITWWVAGQCMMGVSGTIAQDARWGTLEQVRISGASPAGVIFARSANFILYYSLQALVMAAIISVILRLSFPHFPLGFIIIYLITLVGALGLSFVFTGLHIVYKNVAVLSDSLSFLFFFLGGIMSPLSPGSLLYIVSRFIPLSAGIDVMRLMLLEGGSLGAIVTNSNFMVLIVNSAVYFLVGLLVLNWGFRRAQEDGSLAHY